MTDLQKFVELYKSVGIEPELEQNGEDTHLWLKAREQPKLGGYFGFYTVIHFDKEGNFIKQCFEE